MNLQKALFDRGAFRESPEERARREDARVAHRKGVVGGMVETPVVQARRAATEPAPTRKSSPGISSAIIPDAYEERKANTPVKLLKLDGPGDWRRLVLRPAPAAPVAVAPMRFGPPFYFPGSRRALHAGTPVPVTVTEAEVAALRPFTLSPSTSRFVTLTPLPAT